MASLSRLYRSVTKNIPKRSSVATRILDEHDDTKLVAKFKESSQDDLFRRDGYNIYGVVVKRLAMDKKFSLVEEILEHQKTFKDIKSEEFASRLIYLYGKAGMPDHALKTFEQLPDLECECTIKSVSALLKAYVDAEKYDKVMPLYKGIREKMNLKMDTYTSNTMIGSFCKMGDFESAIEMLDEMEKRGMGRLVVSYGLILHGFYSKKEMFSKGEEIWERMVKKGVVPKLQCYNYKLMGICLSGKMEEAVKFVEEMKNNEKVKTDANTYQHLIVGYYNEGNLDEAMKVFNNMLGKGLATWPSIDLLVPYLCQNGELDKALQMCKEGLLNIKGRISTSPIQFIVHALVKHSRIEEAEEFVQSVKGKTHAVISLELPSDSTLE